MVSPTQDGPGNSSKSVLNGQPEFPRRFVPNGLDLGDWTAIAPLFEELEKRPLKDGTAVEAWLLDWSELASCLSEVETLRCIRQSCHTSDQEAERAYRDFVENVDPHLQTHTDKLNRIFAEAAQAVSLPAGRYELLLKDINASLQIFRPENIPLITELDNQATEYQKVLGAMSVDWDGCMTPLAALGPHYESPQREIRERAWKLELGRRFADSPALDEMFSSMISRRDTLARNAGLANFVDYTFLDYRRFDYTPADCLAFHQAVEDCVVPVTRQLNLARQEAMGLDSWRPWDMWWPWYYALDSRGASPLRPFKTSDELMSVTLMVLEKVDPGFAQELRSMQHRGHLDLENRAEKAPGAYSYSFNEKRLPFIFMNATGLQKDVEVLMHEHGHCLHSLAARQEPLLALRFAPIEFKEVASMSLELIGSCHFEEYYNPKDAARARSSKYEGILEFLRWTAQIDAFQIWAYTNPSHTTAQRHEKWVELDQRYAPQFDWSGSAREREIYWQRQHHLFVSPLYYIEYAIAQLGALQLWQNYRSNPQGAIASYRSALALGGTRPVPELFAAAGARFDFSADMLEPLVSELAGQIIY